MLIRPSARSKSKREPINLNLVPILDAMVTIIGFLLYTTTFFVFVSVETMFPIASTKEVQQKLKERPLQLTLSIREGESEIWSPFEKIKPVIIKHGTEGAPDLAKIHEELLRIKEKFPKETKIVLAPSHDLTYEILVAVMDSVRLREKTDPPFMVKNEKTGIDEQLMALFPEVVFGNLLGG